MTPDLYRDLVIRPALSLLPAAMRSREAQAAILAIALQESGLEHRRQLGGGPARGFCQFEFPGVTGVLRHEATSAHAQQLCAVLDVDPVPGSIHAALEYQDLLAAGFARLLLWTLPDRLAGPDEGPKGWALYLQGWRPGKPRYETWPANWARAWSTIPR